MSNSFLNYKKDYLNDEIKRIKVDLGSKDDD